MIRNKGRFNGQQIIPAEAVADIEKGGDKEKFAKAGYETAARAGPIATCGGMTHNEHGAFDGARHLRPGDLHRSEGGDGDRPLRLAPIAANAANDPVTLPAFMAVANELMK